MLLPEFLRSVQSLALLKQDVYLEDGVDKLIYGWTSASLVLITTLLTMRQYFFSSITCYVGTYQQYGLNMVNYVENYCWVSHEGVHHSLGFVFGLMAILLYLPHIIWLMLCQYSAYAPLIEIADRLDSKDKTAMQRFYMASKYAAQRRTFTIFPLLYLIHKMLYILICLSMLVLLQRIIGFQTLAFGLVWESNKFPLTVLCPVNIPGFGAENTYQGLCVLPNNYLFAYAVRALWFWFIVLAFMMFISCLVWLSYYIRKSWNMRFLSMFPPLVGATKGNMSRSYIFFLRVLQYKFGYAFLLEMMRSNDEELCL